MDSIRSRSLSRGSVLGVVLTCLFFSALRSGVNVMLRSAGVPVTIIYAIPGLTALATGLINVQARIGIY